MMDVADVYVTCKYKCHTSRTNIGQESESAQRSERKRATFHSSQIELALALAHT